MLTPAQFADYSAHLAGAPHPLILPHYADYQLYEQAWEKYFSRCVNLIRKGTVPTKISIIAMESSPSRKGNHPGSNYIFHDTHNLIMGNHNKYLNRIYKGVFPMAPLNHMTKQNCLDHLVTHAMSGCNTPRPIILLNLLPSHGVNLGVHDSPQRELARGPLGGAMYALWDEVKWLIEYRLVKIYATLLEPFNLSWENLHIAFATPPNTIYPPSGIIAHIAAVAPGIHIHTKSINEEGNIENEKWLIPSPNNLQALITHHGF